MIAARTRCDLTSADFWRSACADLCPRGQVFYAMVPDVDLDSWSYKTVPITTSAELENLDKNAQYAIMVAARSKAVSGRPRPRPRPGRSISYLCSGRDKRRRGPSWEMFVSG